MIITSQVKKWWPAGAMAAVVLTLLIIIVLIARANGKKELRTALNSLREAEAYHAILNLELALPVRAPGREQPFRQVEIWLEGDVLDKEAGAEFAGRLFAEARGRGNIFFVDGDIVLLEDATAFRLENLPALLNPSGSLVEKWTYVDASLLNVNNQEEILAMIGEVLEKAEKGKKEGDIQWWQVAIREEEEKMVIEAIRPGKSGSEAWGVLTRILRAYEVKTLALAVDKKNKELRQVVLVAGERMEGGEISDKVKLTMEFSEYGKEVIVERPPQEATAKREVFGKVFGSGELGVE